MMAVLIRGTLQVWDPEVFARIASRCGKHVGTLSLKVWGCVCMACPCFYVLRVL